MCGIAGFVDCNFYLSKEDLLRMSGCLEHRGPDGSGAEMFLHSLYQLGLAHRRLSIIDLSPAASQPMRLGHLQIIFNGEIYNYREIRKELQDKYNREFFTASDTEVILHAFDVWGTKSVHKFIGMFAFALYDEREHKLFLFRDRAGVKPLYYCNIGSAFLFSSEIKSFHPISGFDKTQNAESLMQYMHYGYVPEPDTLYNSVKKLQAGHYMEIDCIKNERKLTRYWDVLDYYSKPKLALSYQEAKAEVEKLLISACMYRMVSDVPVGVFLSGGYDSTLVSALIQANSSQKIKTFSIGFEEAGFDESAYAKAVASYLGTDHREEICSKKDAVDIIAGLPVVFDEPFGDSSAIPTILVSRMARKNVTVALSADGGDEIFGGYERYSQSLQMEGLKNRIPSFLRYPLGKAISLAPVDFFKFKRNGKLLSSAALEKYSHLFTEDLSALEFMVMINQAAGNRKLLLNQPVSFKKSSYRNNFSRVVKALKQNEQIDLMLATDYKTYLPEDILTKVDRACMSVSLEGREPLLDHRIIEFVAQIPAEFKIREGVKKAMLKDIVHQYVPKNIMDRPKMGFAVPVEHWMKSSLSPLFEDHLSESKIKNAGCFNAKEVSKMKRQYFEGDISKFTSLWYLFNYMRWDEHWN